MTCEYLHEFSKKFETVLMGYSVAGGKLIHKKTRSKESRDTVPLNKGEKLDTPKKPCLNTWQGSTQLSPPSLSPLPSEFCTDEDNSVIRSVMDAARYSKNNYPSNCNHSLFIYFFQFDLGCTSYLQSIKSVKHNAVKSVNR